jgi:phytoene dehydrogenase-like protein
MENKSIIIIGAGFAGLSAGIYAQMNGYKTQIFEMHSLPGGLCTAWKREGYTIDGCIHWLVGSNPETAMYRYWLEVGIAQDREFINSDEYMRYEGDDGRTFIIYTDVDRLEKHMLELSPQDAEVIKEFISGVRLGIAFDPPGEYDKGLKRISKTIKFYWTMISKGREFQRWMTVTARDFSALQGPAHPRRTRRVVVTEFFHVFPGLHPLLFAHQKCGLPDWRLAAHVAGSGQALPRPGGRDPL